MDNFRNQIKTENFLCKLVMLNNYASGQQRGEYVPAYAGNMENARPQCAPVIFPTIAGELVFYVSGFLVVDGKRTHAILYKEVDVTPIVNANDIDMLACASLVTGLPAILWRRKGDCENFKMFEADRLLSRAKAIFAKIPLDGQ